MLHLVWDGESTTFCKDHEINQHCECAHGKSLFTMAPHPSATISNDPSLCDEGNITATKTVHDAQKSKHSHSG
jgi:hypothetical protein